MLEEFHYLKAFDVGVHTSIYVVLDNVDQLIIQQPQLLKILSSLGAQTNKTINLILICSGYWEDHTSYLNAYNEEALAVPFPPYSIEELSHIVTSSIWNETIKHIKAFHPISSTAAGVISKSVAVTTDKAMTSASSSSLTSIHGDVSSMHNLTEEMLFSFIKSITQITNHVNR